MNLKLRSELAKILLGKDWHSTTQLAGLIRDKEVISLKQAWSRGISHPRLGRPQESRSLFLGYKLIVRDVLKGWFKHGKIEKNWVNNHVEWKAADLEWLKGVRHD